ncbi:MAG: quinolinate synthase NadA [Oscillospiraceae bacterium]|jgi:quinolinate synthase|nr:quinolinate synthase NadA [Oscillospiraceae bacterium]
MTIAEVQEKIREIKRERGICVLAHSYQAREILEVADYTGDSYKLSVAAAEDKKSIAIMCGVRFMAETVKLLSPEKTVFLANADAGCPMADGLSADRLRAAKEKYPGSPVVCYINTTAEVKALSDVCVTSSSAVAIIRAMPESEILFVPDCNLGAYVADSLPEKTVHLINGGCPIHAAVSGADVAAARRAHPGALLLVHPECVPDVTRAADYVGSTSGIYDYAVKSDKKEFIIGTEVSIAEHLQYACPDKKFYPLTKKLMCHNMKLTTLMDLYHCLVAASGGSDGGGEQITIEPSLMTDARRCIDEMIRLGEKGKDNK